MLSWGLRVASPRLRVLEDSPFGQLGTGPGSPVLHKEGGGYRTVGRIQRFRHG